MSELRQDLVSGDWIIVAPERFRRPQTLLKKKPARKSSPAKTCPFEDAHLRTSSHWPPMLESPSGRNWRVVVVPNKYPALRHIEGCSVDARHGPHAVKTGAGAHDLVITRDHRKSLVDLELTDAVRLFRVIQDRHRMLRKDKCNLYPVAFLNYGAAAGESVYHPHYQILTLPIIPPAVAHSLNGSRKYFNEHRACVHCVMLRFDRKEKKRVIDENRGALSIAPYVSRTPFEVRVFPKKHLPRFEETSEADLRAVVGVLQSALRRIKKQLHDPDLNFFIHTAPFNGAHGYYHWHIEITPKISTGGGFELGTGIDINVVDPEVAAAVLKGKSTVRKA